MSVDTPDDQMNDTPEIIAGDAVVTDSATTGADTGATEPDGEGQPSSMLEAVMGAVKTESDEDRADDAEPAEGQPTSSDTQGVQATGDKAEEPKTLGEAAAKEVSEPEYVPDDEWKHYGPRARKRIERLRAQTRELKQSLEEVKSYREEVEGAQIAPEDRKLLLAIGQTLQKGDFQTFLAAIEPYYQLAKEATGQSLPKDLQEQVDDGYTTTEIASELARKRFEADIARSQAQTAQQKIVQTQTAEQTTQLRRVVSDWEDTIKARDPDYAHKADDVRQEARKLVQIYGEPRTPQDVLNYVSRAYDEVNKLASKYGNRAATRPTPTSGFRSGGNTRTAPNSMLDAVMAGLSAR